MYTLQAPCHFGIESVLKREITDLGLEIKDVTDGRVRFFGDAAAIARANIYLRTPNRILLEVGYFKARTFDQLFEAVKACPWEDYLPADAKFWVTKATSVKSKLFSTTDIQRIVKKAIVERLKNKYQTDWFKEDGADYPIRVFINKDMVTVALDTSGEALSRRGYRKSTAKAPIAENLAAALILLTPWHADRILVDPFCGSGTIPIEAAMIAADQAPGLEREFTSQNWQNLIPKKVWYEVSNEAYDRAETGLAKLREIDPDIQGYDIDPKMVAFAKENAKRAGLEEFIHFQTREVKDLNHRKKYGFIITNPPYGERLEDLESLPSLYQTIGERYRALDSWSAYVITSYEDAPKDMGLKATKNRKIYNGMIKTYFYQFMGPKPPKRKALEEQN